MEKVPRAMLRKKRTALNVHIRKGRGPSELGSYNSKLEQASKKPNSNRSKERSQ